MPATVEAKANIIIAKTYAAALYGVEAAKVTPAKVAKLTAAVIDVFKSRNNNHNVDRFFATMGSEEKDLDPMVQIYGRRAMQIRRSSCKSSETEKRMKQILTKYATRHKIGSNWPKWYHDMSTEEPSTYPVPQPHPNTHDHANDWDVEIDDVGPVGLFIESAVWNGLKVDSDFNVWQKGEEPVNILKCPYQNLKKLLHMQATRARTLAEWRRDTSTRMTGLREIDRKASLVSPKLSEEEKGIVRSVQMGGTMAKQHIATFDQSTDDKCTYCKEEGASGSHV